MVAIEVTKDTVLVLIGQFRDAGDQAPPFPFVPALLEMRLNGANAGPQRAGVALFSQKKTTDRLGPPPEKVTHVQELVQVS